MEVVIIYLVMQILVAIYSTDSWYIKLIPTYVFAALILLLVAIHYLQYAIDKRKENKKTKITVYKL